MATETQIIREAPEVEAYKLGLLEDAKKLADQEINIPVQSIADMSGLQTDAIAAASPASGGIGGYESYLTDAGSALTDAEAAISGAAAAGQPYISGAAGKAQPYLDQAGAGITATQMAQYMNPYQAAIQAEIDRSYDMQAAQAGLGAAGAGAFGGSRAAVQQAEIGRNRAAALAQAQAQNFLQADLTNLNNKQSTELFKDQQRIQSLFTDQAALNAAEQFNATSQNQTDQFFAQMQNQTSQFNASQANAQAQFNAGQVNVIERFNAEINNQRDQFNAQNRLIIDQGNAQWRRQIATADTAAVNRSNEVNAQSLLGYSQTAYNNLWQFYKDNMHWAWTSADNERDRYARIAQAQIQADSTLVAEQFKADAELSSGFGSLVGKILTTDLTKTFLGGLF